MTTQSVEYFIANLPLAIGYLLLNSVFLPLNYIQNKRKIKRVLKSKIDEKMPYLPALYGPYIAGLFMLMIGHFVLAWFLPPVFYRAVAYSLLANMVVQVIIWTVWPCRIERERKKTDGSKNTLVKWIKLYGHNFGDYNSFPSGHVSVLTIMFLWLMVFWPTLNLIWLILLILNFLSVLLTHQHYFADAVLGLLLGLVFFLLGNTWL